MKMNVFKALTFTVLGGLVVLSGCATKAEPYSYAQGANTASISFERGNPDVYFVSFDGKTLPEAEKGTHWDPIVFPTGRTLRVTVHTKYEHEQKVKISGGGLFGAIGAVSTAVTAVNTITRAVDKEVVFVCPALRAGEYKLTFEKGSGVPGTNTLILTDILSKEVVHKQEFE